MNIMWHQDFIYHLANVVRPKVYVELGLGYCSNFNRIIDYADRLIGVDMNADAGKLMSASPKVTFFHGSTQDFVKELNTHPLQIDMLFIDADHAKDAVLQDFKSIFPFISPHGLILLHDTHPGNEQFMHPSLCGTAYQAIEELSKQSELYEMVTIPVSPGLTICRKRQKQLSWHEKVEDETKPKKKVMLFTPSYRRPYMLRQCILNAKNQSYTDFTHSISIMYDDESEIPNYEAIFDDVLDERFIIQYKKNSSTHANAMTAISQSPSTHDIYIMMDDDDIYKKDYVKTIVEYFDTHHCDILSSKVGYQLNNYHLTKGEFRSLGGNFPDHHFQMPMTFAFSHKAYQIIANIKDNYNYADLQWRMAWSENGLKDDNVDNSSNAIWHIHGKNVSVGSWFRP